MAKQGYDTTIPPNLALLFKDRVEKYPDIICHADKDEKGEYQYFTYSQVYKKVLSMALALKQLGVHRGSNVALISDNRKEWLVSDLALQSLGAADVPRGCDSMGNEIRFIISFADCEVGFFENARQLQKVLDKADETPLLKTAILFEKPTGKESEEIKKGPIKALLFDDLLEQGAQLYNDTTKKELEDGMKEISGDDVATLIFTSGTTGTPKGAMITHSNFISELAVIRYYLPCKPGEYWMSVLPVWHIFERLIQYVSIYFSASLAYSKPIGSLLLKDMAVIKPHWMCGVPRLWQALATGVNKAMNKTGGVVLKLYKFFVAVGKKYAYFKVRTFGNICQFKRRSRVLDAVTGFIPMILLWPFHKLGDILVFKKIRAKFGGRLNIAISGGGALQKDTDDWYRALGLNLLEGYGLTETSPVISFRDYRHPRPGCVGLIFPGWEIKIMEEKNGVVTSDKPLPPGKQGMIYVRGPQLMKGYYKRPDLTEKALDSEGYFNTGDIGIMTLDNEIKITGRAKDTIVLLGGENVEPAVLESALCGDPLIESAMIVGQDKRALGALIVPSKEVVEEYAKAEGLDVSDYPALLKNEKVHTYIYDKVSSIINPANGFRSCERIGKIGLISESFKIGVELSAKQEMMRYKISEEYADLIASLFVEG